MKTFLLYSLVALIMGYCLDMIIGDPYFRLHPIRLIGNFIGALDKCLNKVKYIDGSNATKKGKQEEYNKDFGNFIRGLIAVVTAIVVVGVIVGGIQYITYSVHPCLYVFVEAILISFALAQSSLRKESMKVFDALQEGNLEKARVAVSMIVGRDTDILDESGVAKAAVETVAENTSDGIIAPLICAGVFGSVGAYIYKVINTCDSMLGYRNERFVDFGKFAARLDDVANFIPARISAILMIVSAGILRMDMKNAWKSFKRDRYNHASPNSGQTESACAGALDIMLAGDTVYGGKVISKPSMGDDIRRIEPTDIRKSCNLMNCTCILMMLIIVLIKGILLC